MKSTEFESKLKESEEKYKDLEDKIQKHEENNDKSISSLHAKLDKVLFYLMEKNNK